MTNAPLDDEGFLRVTLVLDDDGVDPLSLPGGLRGQVLAGRYRVGGLIGRGGASEVYAAEQLDGGAPCAVKVLLPHVAADPEHKRRFEREARAAALMTHPNVVRVLCLVEDVSRGVYFIVMELGEGRSLASLLARLGAPPPLSFVGDALGAALDVTAHAHARGVLHRDLKPENVLLVERPPGRYTPKLLDFGLARVALDPSSHSLTGPSMVRGTPAYMSPEQCRSLVEAGPESDVYALGCVAFELLAGRVPFDAGSPMEILARQMFAAVPEIVRPADAEPLPDGLRALVTEMLSKEPRARPSAEAAFARLRASLEGAGVALGGFALPTHAGAPAAQAPPQRAPTRGEPRLPGKRVAVLRLGERRALVDAVVDGLAGEGATVDVLSQSEVAVAAASALVVDCGADVPGAFALAARVRRARPAMKLIVVASVDVDGAPPGVAVLRAPVTLDALVAAVARRR